MRQFIVTIAVLANLTLIFSVSLAFAGQNDKRLNILFDRLQETQDQYEARSIESTIWKIWIENKNDKVNQAMLIGISLMNDGQLESALKNFSEVIRLAPDFSEGWNKRATVYYLMKKFDQSVKDIVQTLRLEPRHFGALSGLGLINQAIGQTGAAIKAYEQALGLNPHLFGLKEKIERMKKLLYGRET